MLREIFGFAEHQEKATYGLGDKITISRITDYSVLNKTNATNNTKTNIIGFQWFLPH